MISNFIQVVVDACALGSLYALVALAIGLIFGIMKLINFAQSSYITCAAYVLIVPTAGASAPLLLGALPSAAMVFSVLLVTVLLAMATEVIAFRKLRDANPATLLVTSFAVAYFIDHFLMIVYTGRPKSVDLGSGLAQAINIAGIQVSGVVLLTMGSVVVMAVLFISFLRYTALGIQMRAAAENFTMARLLGVRANIVVSASFAISGIISAVVALIFVVQTGTLDIRMGLMPVIYGFFATVIGGMGSLLGSTLGGFLVGFVSVLLQAYLPEEVSPMRDALLFTIVIIVLLVRPQGLIATSFTKQRV